MQIPPSTLRLFHGYSAESLVEERYRPFLIERLLEEGDSNDLQWLCTSLPESELRECLRARSGRSLSKRNLAFWRLALGLGVTGARPGEELWPL